MWLLKRFSSSDKTFAFEERVMVNPQVSFLAFRTMAFRPRRLEYWVYPRHVGFLVDIVSECVGKIQIQHVTLMSAAIRTT